MLLLFGFVITELSVMEQRYQAVLEVEAAGVPALQPHRTCRPVGPAAL